MTGSQSLEEMLDAKRAELAAMPLQLKLWPDSKRAMPIEFVGASVFSAIQSQDTPYVKRLTPIVEWQGYRLNYKGRRLTQVHADVWQGVLEIAKWQPVEGAFVRFRTRQLLRIIGRECGSANRKQLHEWITDMASNLVEVTMPGGKRGYFGPMFSDGAWEKSASGEMHYSVRLHRLLCEAFDRGFSAIDWEQRRKLRRNELALWLQQYVAVFPRGVSVAELRSLSGGTAQTLKGFRRKLRIALATLARFAIIRDWRIDDEDRLHVAMHEQLTGGDRVAPGGGSRGTPLRLAGDPI